MNISSDFFIKHFCRIVSYEVDPIIFTDQIPEIRTDTIKKILKLVFEADTEFIRILEIGSWNGQSAILFAEALLLAGKKGNVFCVDPWAAFKNAEEQDDLNKNISRMSKIAEQDRIFPLFWDNIKEHNLTEIVIPVRGTSETVLPCLRRNFFDLVFIDGSHTHSDFVNDLKDSTPLLKPNGFLCGDDLECQYDEIDISNALLKKEKDFIEDPATGKKYHPGITLGIKDFFGRKINSSNDIWIVQKRENAWVDVIL